MIYGLRPYYVTGRSWLNSVQELLRLEATFLHCRQGLKTNIDVCKNIKHLQFSRIL